MSDGPEISEPEIVAVCPGRVNLIGDHTDYSGGLALPMTVDLATTVRYRPDGSDRVTVTSSGPPGWLPALRGPVPAGVTHPAGPPDGWTGSRVDIPIDLPADPIAIAGVEPSWVRLVAAVFALAGDHRGGRIAISSTVPVGAGLSSSAATAVATALALGVCRPPLGMAEWCREAEALSGTPSGIMDPLVCSAGRAGHALAIDFATGMTEDVPLPPGAVVVVVDSGERRVLTGTPYASRVTECRSAHDVIGPLPGTGPADWRRLVDP